MGVDAPPNTIPFGVKLSAMAQKDFYQGIKKATLPTTQRGMEINVGRIQACAAEAYRANPMPEAIWKTTRHKDLTKKTCEFIWKCIHNAFKVGKFWSNIENYKRRGICPHCKIEESMEHILTECDTLGRQQIWSLANELWHKRATTDIPTS